MGTQNQEGPAGRGPLASCLCLRQGSQEPEQARLPGVSEAHPQRDLRPPWLSGHGTQPLAGQSLAPRQWLNG